jgi:hypothetical protein
MLSSEVTAGQDAEASQYNALRQDVINKVVQPKFFQFTRAMNAGAGTEVIPHGLGAAPAYIQVIGRVPYFAYSSTDAAAHGTSDGFSDGTNHSCVAAYTVYHTTWTMTPVAANHSDKCLFLQVQNVNTGGTMAATAAFDATNITLTFAHTGSQSHTAYITILAVLV